MGTRRELAKIGSLFWQLPSAEIALDSDCLCQEFAISDFTGAGRNCTLTEGVLIFEQSDVDSQALLDLLTRCNHDTSRRKKTRRRIESG
jgi:hypothetical protein